MRIFWTKEAYRKAVKAELRKTLPDDISYLMLLYSENPELLRSACAAHLGVSSKHVDENSMMFKPMSRAIKAYAEGVKAIRESRAQ